MSEPWRNWTGPVIVGVDGTERSIDALALADRLASPLRRPVVIAHVHPLVVIPRAANGEPPHGTTSPRRMA